ncbi:MAG: CehA/McbA family metallohydrolase [Verrucomicrobia bacterium]|nr:CehA/McbA family metallohydrolase [Verrucomicrobiota bacterium]
MNVRQKSVCGAALTGFTLFVFTSQLLFAATLPIEKNVEWQPFAAQVSRLIEASDYLGSPFSADEKKSLEAAMKDTDTKRAVEKLQEILDRHCLFGVSINPEMRVKVAAGPAKPELVEQGWRQFLVKVVNDSGTTAPLQAVSPNAISVYSQEGVGPKNNDSDKFYRKKGEALPLTDAKQLWLELQTYDQQPLGKSLSGLSLEYRIIQLSSRDAGRREAKFSFNVGQGTQDIGYRNEVDTLFTCLPARTITLSVRDENNQPTTASFVIRDTQHRVYPSQAKRLAPDFPFHPQVYRGDGETLKLPDGEYTVEFSRGPESITQTQNLKVDKQTKQLLFQVQRWIDPSQFGWWSGDHHIHAAGCAHYVKPTEGVLASDMIRHCMGEDLKVGANLTWGPCFDYQKQFFCGALDKVSQYPYLLRYDIEVSGFGSHNSGHLVLLRLKEEIYPGGDSKDHWPTLCLNTLRWAKKQGSVCGPAHSGWGLEVKTNALPNYIIPPFNGIGANEYIVDVTHELPGPDGKLFPAVDFLSMVDTPYVWELNMWYHTLNVGYRTRVSGETDFPCIYGEKVGIGRSYVKLDGKLDYDQWCEEIRKGRNYVSDGKSHLMEFKVNEMAVGEKGSELKLSQPTTVKVTARVAARLNEQPNPTLQRLNYASKPYWDIERARIDDTREVPVEVIVNGYPVGKKNIVADGKLQDVSFDVKIDRSSWVAMRILPSSHTNPIFVLVDGKPIRASKRSADWCLQGVDRCWSQKEKFIKPAEKEEAKAAYDHARAAYQKLLSECEAD